MLGSGLVWGSGGRLLQCWLGCTGLLGWYGDIWLVWYSRSVVLCYGGGEVVLEWYRSMLG